MKKLFIGNFPRNTLMLDIHTFLKKLDLKMEYQTQSGKDCHGNPYHFVITTVANTVDIDELINRYDKTVCNGNELVFREYKDRLPCPENWDNTEQRINPY